MKIQDFYILSKINEMSPIDQYDLILFLHNQKLIHKSKRGIRTTLTRFDKKGLIDKNPVMNVFPKKTILNITQKGKKFLKKLYLLIQKSSNISLSNKLKFDNLYNEQINKYIHKFEFDPYIEFTKFIILPKNNVLNIRPSTLGIFIHENQIYLSKKYRLIEKELIKFCAVLSFVDPSLYDYNSLFLGKWGNLKSEKNCVDVFIPKIVFLFVFKKFFFSSLSRSPKDRTLKNWVENNFEDIMSQLNVNNKRSVRLGFSSLELRNIISELRYMDYNGDKSEFIRQLGRFINNILYTTFTPKHFSILKSYYDANIPCFDLYLKKKIKKRPSNNNNDKGLNLAFFTRTYPWRKFYDLRLQAYRIILIFPNNVINLPSYLQNLFSYYENMYYFYIYNRIVHFFFLVPEFISKKEMRDFFQNLQEKGIIKQFLLLEFISNKEILNFSSKLESKQNRSLGEYFPLFSDDLEDEKRVIEEFDPYVIRRFPFSSKKQNLIGPISIYLILNNFDILLHEQEDKKREKELKQTLQKIVNNAWFFKKCRLDTFSNFLEDCKRNIQNLSSHLKDMDNKTSPPKLKHDVNILKRSYEKIVKYKNMSSEDQREYLISFFNKFKGRDLIYRYTYHISLACFYSKQNFDLFLLTRKKITFIEENYLTYVKYKQKEILGPHLSQNIKHIPITYTIRVPFSHFYILQFLLFNANVAVIFTRIPRERLIQRPKLSVFFDPIDQKWCSQFFQLKDSILEKNPPKPEKLSFYHKDVLFFSKNVKKLAYPKELITRVVENHKIYGKIYPLLRWYPKIVKALMEIIWHNYSNLWKKVNDYLKLQEEGEIHIFNTKRRIRNLIFSKSQKKLLRSSQYTLQLHPKLSKMKRFYILFFEQSFYCNPWIFYNTWPLSGLFYYGLQNAYYWGSQLDSVLVLEYYLPSIICEDTNSHWNRILNRIQNKYGIKLQIFEVEKEWQAANPRTISQKDHLNSILFTSRLHKNTLLQDYFDYSDDNLKGRNFAYLKSRFEGLNDYSIFSFGNSLIKKLKNHGLVRTSQFEKAKPIYKSFGLHTNIMAILDVSNLKPNKIPRFIRSLKRKVFNAPMCQIIQLNSQDRQFILVLCRIKNAIGHFIGQFQDWCDKRKIYSHISPIYDLTQINNPSFPISKFISLNRDYNLFQKAVARVSSNSLFDIVNFPLYLPKGCKNVDGTMNPYETEHKSDKMPVDYYFSLNQRIIFIKSLKENYERVVHILKAENGNINRIYLKISELFKKESKKTENEELNTKIVEKYGVKEIIRDIIREN